MRPLAGRDFLALDELAAVRRVEAGLYGVVVVEHSVHDALRVDADAEVRADRVRGSADRVAFVCHGALDDSLRDIGSLGEYPALDSELLQEVLGVDRPDLDVAGDGVCVLAR